MNPTRRNNSPAWRSAFATTRWGVVHAFNGDIWNGWRTKRFGAMMSRSRLLERLSDRTTTRIG
jgi:hypothetical protein